MRSHSIDHAKLSQLVEAGAVRTAQVVARPGGWGVLVQCDARPHALAATRSRQARVFRKLDTLTAYLKGVGINHFDVDATAYTASAPSATRRPDRAEAMRRTHAAAAHDAWFREQVRAGLGEADDPAATWLEHDTVKQAIQQQRQRILLAAKHSK